MPWVHSVPHSIHITFWLKCLSLQLHHISCYHLLLHMSTSTVITTEEKEIWKVPTLCEGNSYYIPYRIGDDLELFEPLMYQIHDYLNKKLQCVKTLFPTNTLQVERIGRSWCSKKFIILNHRRSKNYRCVSNNIKFDKILYLPKNKKIAIPEKRLSTNLKLWSCLQTYSIL